MLSKLRSAINRLFTKHLLLSNTATVCGLLTLGDGVVQKIEQLYEDEDRRKPYDYKRSARAFVLGLAMGPFSHIWYKNLDRLIPGEGGKVVLKKILADQLVAGPFFCSVYIGGISALEGHPIKDCVKEVREKFLVIYLADWMVWPPAQFINFYFLPTRYRVAYVSVITLFWNAFLSFIKHKKELNKPWEYYTKKQ